MKSLKKEMNYTEIKKKIQSVGKRESTGASDFSGTSFIKSYLFNEGFMYLCNVHITFSINCVKI